jgi:hypothetical protein
MIKDSFSSMGLDALGGAIPKLEKEGLLDSNYAGNTKDARKDLDGVTDIFIELFGAAGHGKKFEVPAENEAGMKVLSVDASERNLLEGLSAMVADKRKSLIDNIGEAEWQSFDSDEQNWLTYAAYQWGEGNVINLVKNGELRLRDRGSTTKLHSMPITQYPKYRNGKPVGQVENIHDYIFRNEGRKFIAKESLRTDTHDFHSMAAQVAVSAKVSDAFFRTK